MIDPIQHAWGREGGDARFSSGGECAARITRFERTVRRRNLIEYIAGAIVIAIFGASAADAWRSGDQLIAAAFASIAFVTPLVLLVMHRFGSVAARRPEDSCVAHLRGQLERQRRLVAWAPLWYVGPFLPGAALYFVALDRAGHEVGIRATLTFAIFGAIALLNRLAARGLDREIAELERAAAA